MIFYLLSSSFFSFLFFKKKNLLTLLGYFNRVVHFISFFYLFFSHPLISLDLL